MNKILADVGKTQAENCPGTHRKKVMFFSPLLRYSSKKSFFRNRQEH